MHNITVTATAGKSELHVVIVGHSDAKVPKLVGRQAARIAKGEIDGPVTLLCEEGLYLLVKLSEKAWYVGGEAWRMLGKTIVDAARAAKTYDVTVHYSGSTGEPQALVEGLILADYRYDVLRSGKAAKRADLTVRVPKQIAAVKAGIQVAAAQNLARELADMPPNLLNPKTFAQRAQKELRGSGLTVKVISGNRALTKANFPGLVQVGQAGSEEPALVEIKYVPKKAAKDKHLALVGKGITFDTGGISIKPSSGMWEMKADMSGAAAVLAAMTLIAQQQPALRVTGYLCLAENMPDKNAQRPGDIYIARNGKTIHVDNTDAEGRLVLADVLTYAAEQGATHMVDVATLTGACLVALGDRVSGLLGRHDNFLQTVRQAGQEVGEEHWQLPLYGEYRSLIDHPHADMNNVGGRNGGTITAALFLSEFVPEKVQWAHLDIAGPAIQTSGWRYYAKGMTGFATRTLARIAEKLA
jgi:leucyl aminopeptidase